MNQEQLIEESKKRFDKWLEESMQGLDPSKYKLEYEFSDITTEGEVTYKQTIKVSIKEGE